MISLNLLMVFSDEKSPARQKTSIFLNYLLEAFFVKLVLASLIIL
jgi:hypothetical protein